LCSCARVFTFVLLEFILDFHLGLISFGSGAGLVSPAPYIIFCK